MRFFVSAPGSSILCVASWHRVYIDGYWMDKTEVTNGQFSRFVKATGYVTVAERTPRAAPLPAFGG
jgi:formylglycine-generating enzyme required for sulfatase activity